MRINTKNFGEIDIEDSSIIEFKNGLIGFDLFKKFSIINIENEGFESFFCLQSIEEPSLSFIITDLSKSIPEYNPIVDQNTISDSEIDIDNIEIYNTITLADEISDSTINLKAPIIIDNNKGIQIICQNDDYPIKARFFNLKELV